MSSYNKLLGATSDISREHNLTAISMILWSLRYSGSKKIVFLREEHTDWLSGTKWTSLKIYIQVTLDRLSNCIYILRNICPYTYMYVTTMRKRGFEFERARRGILEALERGNGGSKWYNYSIISKITNH